MHRGAGGQGALDLRGVTAAAVAQGAGGRRFRTGRVPRGQADGVSERLGDEPGPDGSGRAGALYAQLQGGADPAPPLWPRRDRGAHARGSRQAVFGDARADPPDRGQGAAQAAPSAAGPSSERLRRSLMIAARSDFSSAARGRPNIELSPKMEMV